MTDNELLKLKDGTPIVINSDTLAKRITTYEVEGLDKTNEVGYFIGNLKVPSSYIRLATKEDIEAKYEERLANIQGWRDNMLKALGEAK